MVNIKEGFDDCPSKPSFRQAMLFEGLSKTFELARDGTIHHLVADLDNDAAQDGWVDSEGDNLGADLGEDVFLDAGFLVLGEHQGTGDFSGFALEVGAIQHNDLAIGDA